MTSHVIEEVLASHDETTVRAYISFHRRRYHALLELVDEVLPTGRSSILDVGPFAQTELMRRSFANARVDTVGLADRRFPGRPGEQHHELDLNSVSDPASRPEIEPHDVVVLAEVLEHLHTAPALVLRWLAGCLNPGGHLIVQTPNACAIQKRAAMLFGRNPFQMIETEDAGALDLGHIREFTVDELLELGRGTGLELRAWRTANYFDGGNAAHSLFIRAQRLLPPRFRDGISVVFARP